MQRKILLTIVIICVVGISVLLCVFLKNANSLPNNANKAIPADAALVVEIRKLADASQIFSSEQQNEQGISQFLLVKKCREFVAKVDSLSEIDEAFSSFRDNELFYVVKQIGKNKLDFLFIIPLSKNQNADLVKKFIERSFSVENPSSYDFNKVDIYSYKDDLSDRKNLSYAIYGNTLMISESKVSVESSLKGFFEDKNLDSDEDFRKIRPNESSVPARIFFHYDRMASIFQLYASDEYITRIKDFPKIASWTELDVSISSDAVRLNGYITTDSVSCAAEYMNLFNGQQRLRGEIVSVMPASTINFVAMCISDKERYRKNYEEYLAKNSFYTAYNKNMKTLNEAFADNSSNSVASLMYSWIDEELAYVQLPSFSGQQSYENTYGVVKVHSRKQSETELLAMLKTYAEKNDGTVESMERTVGSESYTLYKLPISKIPQMIWGNLFSHVVAKYAFFVDSYLVFANSESSCHAFLNEFEAGKTLSSDADYGRFDDNMKSSYSLYAYSAIPPSLQVYKEFFDEKTSEILDSYSSELKNMNAFSYQLCADNDDKLYNDIFVSLKSSKQDKPEIEWRIMLDTAMAGTPQVFVSHNNELLTFVQDARNTLYLIDNKTRKIHWKRDLDGPIMGKINFVNAFENSYRQYMFNTASSIYMIDRKGNNVASFPVKLANPASAPISVFDYDKNYKYRIAVPYENATIELFSLDRDAKLTKIPEWNVSTESAVKSPLRHFSYAGKDYIVFADTYHVYIVNRRGQTRVEVESIIEKAPNAAIEFEAGAESSLSRFITTDMDGVVKEIFLDGTVVSSEKYGKRTAQHYFMTADIDGDGNGDLIFVDVNKIEVFGQDAKKIFGYSADATLSSPFVATLKNGSTKLCALEKQNGKIYVINADGSLYKGFPLEGRTTFDVNDDFLDKGYHIIVGSDQNLLYYYSIK